MFKNIALKLLVSIFILSLFWLLPGVLDCQAQNLGDWKGVLDEGAGPEGAGYKTEGVDSPEPFIAILIKTILSFLGVIFLLLIIYGGFTWMTAMGSSEKVGKAKEIMTAATIGLILVLLAYSVSYFVVEALTGISISF